MMNEVYSTKHGSKRTKERVGLSKKLADKNAKRAFDNGIKHSDTSGQLNKYFTGLYMQNKTANNIRIYCDKVYIFCGEKLVTVFDLPAKYRRLVRNVLDKKEE